MNTKHAALRIVIMLSYVVPKMFWGRNLGVLYPLIGAIRALSSPFMDKSSYVVPTQLWGRNLDSLSFTFLFLQVLIPRNSSNFRHTA